MEPKKDKFGLIHIYCGDGKGKTTAAVGLCVRACGRGRKCLLTFFKKDYDQVSSWEQPHSPFIRANCAAICFYYDRRETSYC